MAAGEGRTLVPKPGSGKAAGDGLVAARNLGNVFETFLRPAVFVIGWPQKGEIVTPGDIRNHQAKTISEAERE